MKEDMKATIARARQHATDILVVCDALEGRLALEQVKLERLKPGPKSKGKFDRNAYQREYMRTYMSKRRSKAKRSEGITGKEPG